MNTADQKNIEYKSSEDLDSIAFKKAMYNLSAYAQSVGIRSRKICQFFIKSAIDIEYWEEQTRSYSVDDISNDISRSFNYEKLINENASHDEIVEGFKIYIEFKEHFQNKNLEFIYTNQSGEVELHDDLDEIFRILKYICSLGEPILITEVLSVEVIELIIGVKTLRVKEAIMINDSVKEYIVAGFMKYGRAGIKKSMRQIKTSFKLEGKQRIFGSGFLRQVYGTLHRENITSILLEKVKLASDVDIIFNAIDSENDLQVNRIVPFLNIQIDNGEFEIVFQILRVLLTKQDVIKDMDFLNKIFKRILSKLETQPQEKQNYYIYLMVKDFLEAIFIEENIGMILDKIGVLSLPNQEIIKSFIQLVVMACKLGVESVIKNFEYYVEPIILKTRHAIFLPVAGTLKLIRGDVYELVKSTNYNAEGKMVNFIDIYGWSSILIYVEIYWESIDMMKLLGKLEENTTYLHNDRLITAVINEFVNYYAANKKWDKIVQIVNSRYINNEIRYNILLKL